MGKSKNSFDHISRNALFLALGVGLYPLAFYYSRNYGLVNSWEQFIYFTLLFIVLPLGFFTFLVWITKLSFTYKWKKYLIPFFSVFIFLFLINIVLYSGIQKKMVLVIILIAALSSYFLHNHLKRFVIIQLLLAIIGLIGLAPILIKHINHSSAWTEHPDDIANVILKEKPNIYFIQPDGYINFSEFKKEFYQVDNSKFESFLNKNNFKNYPDFRSNYITTLTSNSATFMMKHHYYNHSVDYSEMLHARKNIVSKNAVLDILKNNGYKTHIITEHPYLMANRPKMGYDYSNFDYNEIPYITTGFEVKRDVQSDLEYAITTKSLERSFFFIQIFEPGHISTTLAVSKGKDEERLLWLEKLKIANEKIEKMIELIIKNDPEALIMIMADHGGFVGLDYTRQIYHKTKDRDIIHSAFGSILSIRWPYGKIPKIDSNLKSGVNVFRILFSYLAEDDKYLQHLQSDSSYLILKEGAESGIYEYIDNHGNMVFNKVNASK